jgi:hypothetical protein
MVFDSFGKALVSLVALVKIELKAAPKGRLRQLIPLR